MFKEYLKNEARFIHKPELVDETYDDLGLMTYTMKTDLIFWNGKKQIVIKRADENGVFYTNLASVPSWARWIIKPDDKDLKYPSILHDGLYDKRSFTKRVYADWNYLIAMKCEKVNWAKRWVIFLSVRIAGKDYYKK